MCVNNQIPKVGKFLGIDYGSKRVGIAISDPLRIFASPYDTIIVNSQNNLIKETEEQFVEEFLPQVVGTNTSCEVRPRALAALPKARGSRAFFRCSPRQT